jgi:hypothetical protein
VRALMLLALLACEPTICEEPCQGESAIEERGAGIVCWCGTWGRKFDWTMDDAQCAADRAWWAEHAPFPCPQPGGGRKQERP